MTNSPLPHRITYTSAYSWYRCRLVQVHVFPIDVLLVSGSLSSAKLSSNILRCISVLKKLQYWYSDSTHVLGVRSCTAVQLYEYKGALIGRLPTNRPNLRNCWNLQNRNSAAPDSSIRFSVNSCCQGHEAKSHRNRRSELQHAAESSFSLNRKLNPKTGA